MDFMLDEEAIGEKLQELRNRRGISQREAAYEMHISHEHYSRIEKGTRCMSLGMLYILMNYYGEDANTILCVEKA